jgi:hypothetical protein
MRSSSQRSGRRTRATTGTCLLFLVLLVLAGPGAGARCAVPDPFSHATSLLLSPAAGGPNDPPPPRPPAEHAAPAAVGVPSAVDADPTSNLLLVLTVVTTATTTEASVSDAVAAVAEDEDGEGDTAFALFKFQGGLLLWVAVVAPVAGVGAVAWLVRAFRGRATAAAAQSAAASAAGRAARERMQADAVALLDHVKLFFHVVDSSVARLEDDDDEGVPQAGEPPPDAAAFLRPVLRRDVHHALLSVYRMTVQQRSQLLNQGRAFFDEARVALDHHLSPGTAPRAAADTFARINQVRA